MLRIKFLGFLLGPEHTSQKKPTSTSISIHSHMKLFKHWLIVMSALTIMVTLGFAATMTYSTPPLTTDNELTLTHKQQAALASGNAFSNVSTATTTTVKTGAGVLDRLVINKAGTGTTIVIYDNTAASGTKIATLTSTAQTTLHYNIRFTTGLTIVTDAGSGAADVTVSYR
jgi:hypothetical protein